MAGNTLRWDPLSKDYEHHANGAAALLATDLALAGDAHEFDAGCGETGWSPVAGLRAGGAKEYAWVEAVFGDDSRA